MKGGELKWRQRKQSQLRKQLQKRSLLRKKEEIEANPIKKHSQIKANAF